MSLRRTTLSTLRLINDQIQSIPHRQKLQIACPAYNAFNQQIKFNFCEKKINEQEEKNEINEQKKNEQQKQEKSKELTFDQLVDSDGSDAKQKIRSLYQNQQNKLKETENVRETQKKKIEALEQSQKAAQEKLNELRKNLSSQIEDSQMMKKRLDNEKKQEKVFAITKFAKDLLDVQDNLERALQANKSLEGKNDSLFEGVAITHKLLQQVFARYEVAKMKAVGQKFDPNYHEALMQVEDPSKEVGSVAFIAQDGYCIGDRVLRAAKVGIVKAQ